MAKKKVTRHDNVQDIENALTRTEQFIEDNQKVILYAIGAIVLIVLLVLGFSRFILQPRNKEAQEQMFMAEIYFEKDSFNLALNGDGNYLGFLDIIDDYGMTKAGKLSRYYAGISYLRLGEYEEAISQLSKFKTKDPIIGPMKEGTTGDAYVQLGDTDKALKHYQKAYQMSANEFSMPYYGMKAAAIFESQDQYAKALEIYKTIKEKYPRSNEGMTVDKFIYRASAKTEK